MAEHVRTQIRRALAAALTGLAKTEGRVFVSRDPELALEKADLPALKISTPEDGSERISMGTQGKRQNTVTVEIEYCVQAATGYDDEIDEIEAQVFEALDADPDTTGKLLDGLVQWIEPGAYSFEVDARGEQPVATGKRQFQVQYQTARGAPRVAL